MSLYINNIATCISKAMCMFSKLNGVVGYIYSYCITDAGGVYGTYN